MAVFWDGYDNDVKDFEQFVTDYLDQKLTGSVVSKAVRYAYGSGGKRLRPMLLIAAAKSCGVFADNVSTVYKFALGLELIHCYSLVHDDLPCMDDDDERRGKPSTHIKFGEANAVLAGDAMLNLAYEIMLEDINSMSQINAAKYVAHFAGINGMVDGQSLDINYDPTDASDADKGEKLYQMYLKKTAALIRAALGAGVILAGVSQDEMSDIDDFATMLGISYQITDDLLDVGTEEGKFNFVALYGADKARLAAQDYMNAAAKKLQKYGDKYSRLLALADITDRTY